MAHSKSFYMYALYAVLAAYTAYTYLWSRFGLGVTTIVQYALLGLLLLGLLKYVVSPPSAKNSFVNWLIMLWITQFLGFYLGESKATTQFKECTFVLLIAAPFVSMRYLPRHNKYIMIVLSVISISMFFVIMSLMTMENENSYGGGYLSLVTLPVFLHFTRNRSLSIQILCCCAITILVLMSMKRGDILACVLSLIVYFSIIQKRNEKFDFKVVVGFLFVAAVGYFVYEYLMQNSPVFAWKIQQTLEGDSSGRDDIYSDIWSYFLNSPLDVKLLGGGFDASVKIAGIRAHSDWLEVLSCEGVLGTTIYLGSVLSFFKQIRRCKNNSDKAVLSVILTIWLVKSVFSMFIFSQPTIILFALAGYILNKKIDKQYE